MQRRNFFQLIGLAAAAPSRGHAQGSPGWEDHEWVDPARSRRLPVRVRWPQGSAPCSAVVFSHGLGGNRSGGAVWAAAWQAAGMAVVSVQHPGSDSDIWPGGVAAWRQGASVEQYLERIGDARFVLDEIERLQRRDLAWQRVRPKAVGFCGHSFGAHLTQALAGEMPGGLPGDAARALRDGRPRAFIAFSPGFRALQGTADADAAARFGQIERPFLCVTGTLDDAMLVGDANHAARRAVYRGLPPGHKAELVLDGADHMTFSGQTTPASMGRWLRREPGSSAREPAHQAIVSQVTSDWWRWRLLDDEAARLRLLAPTGLRPQDVWQQG
jgi:dienelactone hydrolase